MTVLGGEMALAPRTGCNPDSDGNDCSPAETESSHAASRRYALNTPGRCNPDSDGDDCSPAETEVPQ